jgi:hypothetical protein
LHLANSLHAEGMRPDLAVLGRLRGLWVLNLSVNRLNDASLSFLGRLAALKRLDLGFNRIRGAGLRHLRGLSRLAVLDLSGNPLPPHALRPLASLTALRVLNLRRTRIGGSGLAHLRGLTRLHTLNLAETLVGDADLTRLHGLRKLRRLDVTKTQVSPAGLAALQRKLPGLRPVRRQRIAVKVARPRPRGGTIGIPACDRYLQIYRCYLSILPAAARGPAQAAFQKTIQAWKRSIAASRSYAARAALARGCRMAVQSFTRALSHNPRLQRCLTP